MPFLPGVFMSDGLKSVAILAAGWALLLGVALPAAMASSCALEQP